MTKPAMSPCESIGRPFNGRPMAFSFFRDGPAFGQAGVFYGLRSYPMILGHEHLVPADLVTFLKIAKIAKLTRRQPASFLFPQRSSRSRSCGRRRPGQTRRRLEKVKSPRPFNGRFQVVNIQSKGIRRVPYAQRLAAHWHPRGGSEGGRGGGRRGVARAAGRAAWRAAWRRARGH